MLCEFDGELSVTYVVKDLSRHWTDLPEFAAEWLEASARDGQPADPRALLEDPPSASSPAGLAIKAVAEQGDAGPFLRRLREAIFLERFKADRGDGLFALAREVGGLDLERLDIAFRSNATVEALAADHERAAGVGIPAIAVAGGEPVGDVARWRETLLAAGLSPSPLPDVSAALQRFGRMTTPEVAAVCDLPGPRAPAELWRLALEWRVRADPVLTTHLWSPA